MDPESFTQCETCWLPVHNDYYLDHQEWHETLREYIRDTAKEAAA